MRLRGLPPPSPGDQIEFLQNVQRILEEGVFTASYKFALLHVLADLAVVHGDDSGDSMTLSTSVIAERFIELYWNHTRPFPGREAAVLRQNTGGKAKILSLIENFQQMHGASLAIARRNVGNWQSLVRETRIVVEKMPLWKLQTVGSSTLAFLYDPSGASHEILLRPGVSFCLRRFHGLVLELARAGWTRYVRATNGPLLGETADLEQFLFGAERSSLRAFSRILAELQEGRCFYCHAILGSASEVDHFIPWLRYPTDLGHNFVLACGPCNNDKRDRLAAWPHLEAWWYRNAEKGLALAREFELAGLAHDREATNRIAGWAYGRLEAAGGLCWERGRPREDRMIELEPEWRTLLREERVTELFNVAEKAEPLQDEFDPDDG